MSSSKAARLEARARHLPAMSASTILLRKELASGLMERVEQLDLAGRSIDVRKGGDSLWAVIRRPGAGGIALRLAFAAGGCGEIVERRRQAGEALRLTMDCAVGTYHVVLTLHDEVTPVLRATTSLEPRSPLLVQFLPRDVYPIDADDDPAGAIGKVEAAQRA